MWTEIKSENDLPEEGKYVLARHTRGTWRDSDDQDNVNCVVVKLVKGISTKTRQEMKDGLIDDPMITRPNFKVLRSQLYSFGDEQGNNKVAYQWEQFGPDSFFGQDISHWQSIEKL